MDETANQKYAISSFLWPHAQLLASLPDPREGQGVFVCVDGGAGRENARSSALRGVLAHDGVRVMADVECEERGDDVEDAIAIDALELVPVVHKVLEEVPDVSQCRV